MGTAEVRPLESDYVEPFSHQVAVPWGGRSEQMVARPAGSAGVFVQSLWNSGPIPVRITGTCRVSSAVENLKRESSREVRGCDRTSGGVGLCDTCAPGPCRVQQER